MATERHHTAAGPSRKVAANCTFSLSVTPTNSAYCSNWNNHTSRSDPRSAAYPFGLAGLTRFDGCSWLRMDLICSSTYAAISSRVGVLDAFRGSLIGGSSIMVDPRNERGIRELLIGRSEYGSGCGVCTVSRCGSTTNRLNVASTQVTKCYGSVRRQRVSWSGPLYVAR